MLVRRVGFLTLIALSGCNASPQLPADTFLHTPPPGEPLVLTMSSTLDASLETERCRFFQAPPEGLWIAGQEVRYTPGSHHVLLFSTSYTSIPSQDSHGTDRPDAVGVFPCADGAAADWDIDGVVAGAQSAATDPLRAPDGVALHVPGNAVLLMNTHYLNAAPHPVDTTATVSLSLVDGSTVMQEAGVLFFYNFWIRVPGHGQAEARMRCPITRDVTLIDAQSHMHARGVGYRADLLHGDGTSEPLYTSDSWENVPVKLFSPGQLLPAGSSVDYRCEYQSNEDRTIRQGLTTKDEMCMFVGVYYPRDAQLEHCALDDSWYTSDLAATHVGRGTASCGESLDCFANAPNDDHDDGFTGCIEGSCPGFAEPLWTAERCRLFHAGGACDEACKTAPSSACTACLEQGCAPELAACRALTACN
jgi:hypothetical protein